MVLNDPKSFSVDVEGKFTKQKYMGVFKVRPLLSHRDKLRREEIRRQLIGTFGENVSEDAYRIASVFSKIWAHLVEAPSWWKDAGNGIELLDEEPVEAVISKLVEFELEITGNFIKEGEKAKEQLTDISKKQA